MVPLIRRYRSLSCFSSTHFHRPPVSFILTSTKLHLLLNIYTPPAPMLIGCRRQCFSLLCRVGQTVVSPPPPRSAWRISGAKPFGLWPLVRVGRSSCSVGSAGPSVLCVYYVVYFLVCQFQKSKGNSEPPPPSPS